MVRQPKITNVVVITVVAIEMIAGFYFFGALFIAVFCAVNTEHERPMTRRRLYKEMVDEESRKKKNGQVYDEALLASCLYYLNNTPK